MRHREGGGRRDEEIRERGRGEWDEREEEEKDDMRRQRREGWVFEKSFRTKNLEEKMFNFEKSSTNPEILPCP